MITNLRMVFFEALICTSICIICNVQEDDGGDREERRRYEQEAEQERRERLLKLADSTGPSKEDLARWRDEYRENVVEKKVTV